MKFHGFDSDGYRAGLLHARTIVESAKRLGGGIKYILRKIDERADELDPLKLAEQEENKRVG
ncbi:hypothetical protein ES703_38524 [subsurface metagenome]